jgi:hypothetical protein
MPDDVVLNKVARLERCITRIREVYAGNDANLYRHLTAQESILLNLQRACEMSIDLGVCPSNAILLRQTIRRHLRRSRPETILNVFHRIRLRLFRACGLASTSSSFAS